MDEQLVFRAYVSLSIFMLRLGTHSVDVRVFKKQGGSAWIALIWHMIGVRIGKL